MRQVEQRIDSVLVVGAGTAGLLAALMLRNANPDLQIRVLYSSRIGHIMVGEGTVGSTPNMFHERAGLDREAFYREVHPTPKLGVRFLWGGRGEFHYGFDPALTTRALGAATLPMGYGFPDDVPLVGHGLSSALMAADRVLTHDDKVPVARRKVGIAYHMENAEFVDHLARVCAARGIDLIECELAGAETDDNGVTSVTAKDGRSFSADLYVDCSGFGGALIHRALGEPYVSMRDHLFCDKAVIGGWAREDEPLRPYTTAETMDAGWCWQIEHTGIINRGYVYCSAFISDEDAEAEYRRKNPKVTDTRIVPFESRHIRRSWVGNVVAIGNANGFVEPLEATNIQIICNYAARLADAVAVGRRIDPAVVQAFNAYTDQSWQSVRDFLAVHYRFNTLLDTPFWRHAREATPLGGVADLVEYYRQVGPDPVGMAVYLPRGDLFGLEGYLSMLVGCDVPYRRDEARLADERKRAAFNVKVNRVLASKCTLAGQVTPADWAQKRPHGAFAAPMAEGASIDKEPVNV